jgi:hypothetical protein
LTRSHGLGELVPFYLAVRLPIYETFFQRRFIMSAVGRIATRATGSFNISTTNGLVQGISHKYCKAIHKKDGYGYSCLINIDGG